MAPHLTQEMKKVVLDMKAQGLSTVEICRAVKTIINYDVTRHGIWKLLSRQVNQNRYKLTKTV